MENLHIGPEVNKLHIRPEVKARCVQSALDLIAKVHQSQYRKDPHDLEILEEVKED